ncbi:uncharacterized protein LOC132255513 [Phlebotomus argentipes]|uniref:uncharacterized protein LOC132255513 n=1 Tax=Phlebotomus argentipes TaxID=94469 RepID=UPI002892C3B0|nr:uncharacterized protein LOC132255513 [Phlebotomus argentipes]
MASDFVREEIVAEKVEKNVSNQSESGANEEQNALSSDSESKLTICTSLPVKKRRLKRKLTPERKQPVQQTTSDDPEVSEVKNLSPDEIRKIIKTVVSNDHVLAIVRLKEEEADEEEVEIEREAVDLMPKLTRLKAKELNKQLPSIIPLTLKPPDDESETAMLLTKELDEEDADDEEYKPSVEDFLSDDETNTSISDVDSQPATPADPVALQEEENSVQYTHDGLFKVPQTCATPSPSKKPPDGFRPPALGTRSKVSLTKTAIEDIEETFVPPDITTDMYDIDCDMDNVWQEFLNAFRRPLPTPETHEEDEEADPEYVAADQIPLDKEELREVKVSRKELSDLMAELFDGINDDAEIIGAEVQQPPTGEEEACGARTKPTPTKYQKNPRLDDTPEPLVYEMPTHSTPLVYHYQPPAPPFQEALDMSAVLENSLDMELLSDSSTEVMNFTAADTPKEIFYKVMELKFRQMSRMQPVEAFEPGQVGFTDFQRQILAQQLRMHVQLNVQHFVQTYSHPKLWRDAEKPRRMLAELLESARSNRNSAFNAINLHGAIELCDSWQREMDVVSEENAQLMRELQETVRLEEERKNVKQWSMKMFNSRIVNLMINSTVFLYPKLLPNIPFRIMPFPYNFHRNEGSVIIHFYDTVLQDLREQARQQRKYIEPSRMRVCEKICRYICDWRNPRQIYKYLDREKRSKTMNPIRFYFENNRLLPVCHVIESINPNQVPADLPTSSLPKNWEAFFLAEKKRKQKAQKEREVLTQKRKRAKVKQKVRELKSNPGSLSRISWDSSGAEEEEVQEEKEILGDLLGSGVVRLKKKLERILREYNCSPEERLRDFRSCAILSKIFNFFWEFDLFVRVLRKAMQADKRAREEEAKKVVDEEQEKPKRHKHRLHDSNRLLLLPERSEDVMQKDSVYSWNFFEKVECTFKAAKQFDKFERFLVILNTFKPGRDEVADLYYRLEDLFLPDHPELAELFLTLLLPGHAAQLGKFFEHFMLTNMQTLLMRINTYFAKQPHQLKKIYACLNELSREEGLTMDKIKARFLPLLKGNQLLTDWFLQLFPNERPPASDGDEFEVVSLRKHVPEEEVAKRSLTEEIQTDRLADPFDNAPCSIKYMQGRIYYGNRVLLPAELSFLAASQEAAESRQDKASRARSDAKCVHEIKQAWDQKIQEGLRLLQSEPPDAGPADAAAADDHVAEQPAKLCDYPTLKMHAYRLNPHAITSEMVLACQESAEEGKASPKKAGGSKKNPTSPKRSATKGGAKVETDSAVEMARRLKMFLTAEEKPPKPRRVRQKKPPEDEEEEEEEEKEEVIPEKVETSEEDVTWTRDQDKVILEVINGELDSEEEVIERLVELMTERTREQITTRFHFLLNVLRKFNTDD